MAGEERRRGGLRCGKDSGTRTREVQQGMGKKRADRTAAKEQRGQHRGSRHHAVVRQHRRDGFIETRKAPDVCAHHLGHVGRVSAHRTCSRASLKTLCSTLYFSRVYRRPRGALSADVAPPQGEGRTCFVLDRLGFRPCADLGSSGAWRLACPSTFRESFRRRFRT